MQDSIRWADIVPFEEFVDMVQVKVAPCEGGDALTFECPFPKDTNPDNVLYISTELLHEDKVFTSGIGFLLEVRCTSLASLYSVRTLVDGSIDWSEAMSYQECKGHTVPAIV